MALKLRDIYGYGSRDRHRLEQKVPPSFIVQLVAQVTAGFKGDVGVVPRQFLRRLVDVFDRVEDEADYDPMQEHAFVPAELTPEEQSVVNNRPLYAGLEDDVGVVEF